MQLMVGQHTSEMASGRPTGAIETVVGPIHLIDLHHRTQTALVERGVMCHQRQPLDPGGYLLPYHRKHIGGIGIGGSQSMHPLAKPSIIVRLRLYQTVKRVRNFAATHYHNAYTAYTAATAIGRLKVYSREITHHKKK